MKELTCIVCPNGCLLKIEGEGENLKVTGARCKRGETFAREELSCPMRTVCTTMKTKFEEIPVIPVRTEKEIPKDKIFELMKVVNSITIKKKYKRGSVVVENILDTGVNIITTSDMTAY